MRLLITTQAVDKHDPILGFFHGWLLEFGKHFEHVDVICLREGVHEFPSHIRVHSLGKEAGVGVIGKLARFYKYVWDTRNDIDCVFSHMNPHYIVLAGWLWKLKGKRMHFWRNHKKMTLLTAVAARYAENVFYTSPYACTSRYAHAHPMPVGIDTDLFQTEGDDSRREQSVLFFGRLSPIKHPEVFIDAARGLQGFECHIYGEEPEGSGAYTATLKKRAGDSVSFHGWVQNSEAPRIYSQFAYYVNLTPEGSMDKTVLEAAACGAIPIVVNTSFSSILPEVCVLGVGGEAEIVKRIHELDALSVGEKANLREQLRASVIEKHSLKKLAQELVEKMG